MTTEQCISRRNEVEPRYVEDTSWDGSPMKKGLFELRVPWEPNGGYVDLASDVHVAVAVGAAMD
jgi:hypothetical protein